MTDPRIEAVARAAAGPMVTFLQSRLSEGE